MKKRRGSKKLILSVLMAVIVISAAAYFLYPGKPYRIGVLLDLTGPDAIDYDEVLGWASGHINSAGGIGGRKIELVYKDTYNADAKALAQELIDDKSIKIVIGAGMSETAAVVAPMFIDAKKLLISPSATSGDLFRMFAKEKFFWRANMGH